MMYPISKTKSIIKDLGYQTAQFSRGFNKFVMKMPNFDEVSKDSSDLMLGCLPNGKDGLFVLLKDNSPNVQWGILVGSRLSRVPTAIGYPRGPVLLAPCIWIVALYKNNKKANLWDLPIVACNPSKGEYYFGIKIYDDKGETMASHKAELNYLSAQVLSVAKRLDMKLPTYTSRIEISDLIKKMVGRK